MSTLSAAEAYQLWAPYYDAADNPVLALEERVLFPHMEDLRGKHVIDLGCGTGRWLRYAAELGAASLVGVDASPAMLSVAQQQCSAQVELMCADVLSLLLESGSADVLIASFLLSYLPSLDAFVAQAARLLRPGGRLLVSDLHPQARANGWRSGFSVEGRSYSIQTYTYSLDSLREGLYEAGLVQKFCEEPGFGRPERAIFERAGREEMFNVTSQRPAIFAAGFVKQ
jgi:ubiquinone/menaquinone biosynthesis C-methylase UbiE